MSEHSQFSDVYYDIVHIMANNMYNIIVCYLPNSFDAIHTLVTGDNRMQSTLVI